MEEVMGTCLDRGIKVVSNAGGLDPEGCAEAVATVAAKLGLNPTIAYVTGDDLLPRMDELAAQLQPFDHRTSLGDLDDYVTANAYLGCWGIVEALTAGADIVVTGRVTDAAVTCGPAAWFHGWTPTDLDRLAGAVVAGHVIECSAQATGGNYSFFSEIKNLDPRLGFPWAAIAADGTSVIGKHDNTGGEVNIGTVTSQLLYEIGGPEYLGPDVTARFDTIELEQQGPDRVRISGVKGSPSPATLKVAMNQMGGYRNSFAVALTGLDIEAKAAFAEAAFWDASPLATGGLLLHHINGCSHGQAGSRLTGGSHGVVALDGEGPGPEQGWPSLQRCHDPHSARQHSWHVLGRRRPNRCRSLWGVPSRFDPCRPGGSVRSRSGRRFVGGAANRPTGPPPTPFEPHDLSGARSLEDFGPTERHPLGILVGARSGDKGGNANLGVFVRSAAQWEWLEAFLSVERLRSLLPETSPLEIERHRFPNLWSLNFLIYGLLEEGVAASTRSDAQAKALGEWLRARVVDVPTELIPR